MSETKTIKGTISKADPGFNERAPMLVTLKNEAGQTTKVKCWKNIFEQFSVGEKGEFSISQKESRDGMELWLEPKEKPKGRGGGVAKSDPVKNENIKACNEKNNDTMRTASALKNATEYQRMALDYLLQQQSIHGNDFTVNDIQSMAIELQKGGANLADMIAGKFSG